MLPTSPPGSTPTAASRKTVGRHPVGLRPTGYEKASVADAWYAGWVVDAEAVPSEVQAALDAWAAFPVEAVPRPLVLWYEVEGPERFPDEDTKNAYESGQFELGCDLHGEHAPVDGLPLIGGDEILARLRAAGSTGPEGNEALRITSVTLGQGRFTTDRGVRDLPAWEVRFDGIETPARVLAVAPEAIFHQPRRAFHTTTPLAGASTVDKRTLDLWFVGSPEDVPIAYEAAAFGSRMAVAAVIESTWTGGDRRAVRAVGKRRSARVTLDEPLGERVLIDGRARYPVPVTDRPILGPPPR